MLKTPFFFGLIVSASATCVWNHCEFKLGCSGEFGVMNLSNARHLIRIGLAEGVVLRSMNQIDRRRIPADAPFRLDGGGIIEN